MTPFKMAVSSLLPVLLSFLVFFRVSVFEHSVTTVKLHEAATLQCSERCSGLVKWTVFHKQKDVLAQCDQTSCQSQEGYQMSHDEYLKGNLSLTITDADFSKRTWYTCQCDGEDICGVSLKLKPFSYSHRVQVGELLSLDLPISDDVEMIFKRSDDDNDTLTLCKVEGRKAECDPSYGKRVSVRSSLQLKEVKNGDGGVYFIRDIITDEIIETYTVVISVFSTVSVSELTSTTVELHEAATLQCSERCSGLVKWTRAHKQKDILAQCNQTSCQSQEGYQMSHDEYLKGNLSLTITDADYSKRTWYTCQCDGKDICDVTLQVDPFSYLVRVQAGEPLSLNLSISDDFEVIFKSSDDVTTTLCTVEGRKAECESSYGKRVSVRSSLQLKEVKNSDGGLYIIRDINSDEVIGTYSVINIGVPAGLDGSNPVKLAVLIMVTMVMAISVSLLGFVKCLQMRRKRRELEHSTQRLQSEEQKPTQDLSEISVHSPVMHTGDVQMTEVKKKLNVDSEAEDVQLETESLIRSTSVTEQPPLSAESSLNISPQT